ncbi:MAG TPA: efflux transporter outer membrane subunit [Caulobacteraceae bacterium]|nr:efflux transporter outer membrane subunit [Caulobacteraceae bacterium]
MRVWISAGLAALSLSACATVPNLGPKPRAKAAETYATAKSFDAPASNWPADRWWDAYNDPQLSKLVDEALAGSPTLAQAEARLRAADAQVEQSRASTLPTLDAKGNVTAYEQSRAIGFPTQFAQFLPKGFHGDGSLTLNASYDLDLFGKNRAALAAAVSDREAVRADAAQARLTLSTAVAQAYGDLIRLSSERNAADETLKDRSATASLESQRVSNGLDTRGQSDQAAAAVPSAQADVEALDALVLVARHRVAALLGEGPDRGLDIAVPAGESVKTFGLPANLAVNLIGRRPDIVAARLRAQSAAKRIDVAHAAFYPNITLNGYIGQSAFGLSDLFKPIAATGQFGPAIDLPIFEGGRLQGQYRGARADYDAAVASYDQTLTQALQDVADAAANAQSSTRQLEERRASLAKGQAAFASAKGRYEGGLSTYLDLLSAEDAVIAERRALADAQAAAFNTDVALVRALGGGFATAS